LSRIKSIWVARTQFRRIKGDAMSLDRWNSPCFVNATAGSSRSKIDALTDKARWPKELLETER
jgi:hypothetical protein